MENLKGNLTSIITAILLPLLAMFSVDLATQNQILALVSALIGLLVWYLDIKYKSNYFVPEEDEENNGA